MIDRSTIERSYGREDQRSGMSGALVRLLLCVAVSGCAVRSARPPLPPLVGMSNGRVSVRVYPNSGTLDIGRAGGRTWIAGASVSAAYLLSESTADTVILTTLGISSVTEPRYDRTWSDNGSRVTFSGTADTNGMRLDMHIYIGSETDLMVFEVALTNLSDRPVYVTELTPLSVMKEKGGLCMGWARPSELKILDNGSWDGTLPNLVTGDTPHVGLWNSAVYHAASRRTLMVGFPSALKGWGQIESAPDASDDGLALLAGVCRYYPARLLAPGHTLMSEPLMVDISSQDPLDALERFADRVALYNEVRLWPEAVVDGATAAFGEEQVLESLDLAKDRLWEYGASWLDVGAAWQEEGPATDNDDVAHASQQLWPHGMKWIADRVYDKRMYPSITWRLGRRSSQIEGDHRQTAYRLAHSWGYRGINIESGWFESGWSESLTRPFALEQWRRTLTSIRESVGPSIWLSADGPLPSLYGLADGLGTYTPSKTSNSIRDWDELVLRLGSSIKRYYLQSRVGHLVSSPWHMGEPLSQREARVYATGTAMLGSVAVLGQDMRTLQDWQWDILRRITPTYSKIARPLDLFENQMPQIWDWKVKNRESRWHVVGLFNWSDLSDAPRTVSVKLSELGLDTERDYLAFEFWSNEMWEIRGGTLSYELPPHSVAAVVIKPRTSHPQFISSNRHVSQGATDVKAAVWRGGLKSIRVQSRVTGGFLHRYTLWVPQEWQVHRIWADDERMTVSRDGNMVTIEFRPDRTRSISWSVRFKKQREQ